MGNDRLSEDILRTTTSPWVLWAVVDCKNKPWESCVHPRSLVIEKTRCDRENQNQNQKVHFVNYCLICAGYKVLFLLLLILVSWEK